MWAGGLLQTRFASWTEDVRTTTGNRSFMEELAECSWNM
ncbi:Hypothetical protein RY70_829 [Bifidobacterium bifidum]|nr:Hypothetical protein RY70_829 [Bifidobacterium bifidum]